VIAVRFVVVLRSMRRSAYLSQSAIVAASRRTPIRWASRARSAKGASVETVGTLRIV